MTWRPLFRAAPALARTESPITAGLETEIMLRDDTGFEDAGNGGHVMYVYNAQRCAGARNSTWPARYRPRGICAAAAPHASRFPVSPGRALSTRPRRRRARTFETSKRIGTFVFRSTKTGHETTVRPVFASGPATVGFGVLPDRAKEPYALPPLLRSSPCSSPGRPNANDAVVEDESRKRPSDPGRTSKYNCTSSWLAFVLHFFLTEPRFAQPASAAMPTSRTCV
ncbi:hypothetical protein EVAR_90241_1 [Eumeta japonica]|uniref:Uncharacterized protein n=1 Tax=Eumeta variegata TaxID=151549 RepID=A0A4C1YTF7_EUMVA|nr:hypothetical protein EVAR_90241_1 [Eumeta japonica]